MSSVHSHLVALLYIGQQDKYLWGAHGRQKAEVERDRMRRSDKTRLKDTAP